MSEGWLSIAFYKAGFYADALARKYPFSEQDRDDLYQDLMLDVIRRFRRYNPLLSSPSHFLELIIRNQAATLLAHARLRRDELLSDQTHLASDPAAEAELLLCELGMSLQKAPRKERVLFQFCRVMRPGEARVRSRASKRIFYPPLNSLFQRTHRHLLLTSHRRF